MLVFHLLQNWFNLSLWQLFKTNQLVPTPVIPKHCPPPILQKKFQSIVSQDYFSLLSHGAKILPLIESKQPRRFNFWDLLTLQIELVPRGRGRKARLFSASSDLFSQNPNPISKTLVNKIRQRDFFLDPVLFVRLAC